MTFEQAKKIILAGGLVGVDFRDDIDESFTCESLDDLNMFRGEDVEFYRI